MKQILDMNQVSIFFNGTFSEPRLNHPEGIAVDKDGNLWCGGEEGEIYRIDSTGSEVELAAKSGGFALGIALDSHGYLYMCDMKFACVFRLNIKTKELTPFASGNRERKMACPNYAVVDEQRGYLYVSDSQMSGPGIWRFRLDTGEGDLWYGDDCVFANGLAMHPDGNALYMVESFAGKISKISIASDGHPESKEEVVMIPDTVPDGLAFDKVGNLYIACFEPSSIYRYDLEGRLELLVQDKQCLTLDRPTNLAFRNDDELFSANLGAYHISLIDLG